MYQTPSPRRFFRPALLPALAALLLAACSGGHPRATPAAPVAGGGATAASAPGASTATAEAATTPQATPSPSLTASLRPGVAPIGRATPARGSSGPSAQASGTPSQPLTPA